MTNEYGAVLDRHGYAPSILQKAECCFKCGRTNGKLDRHEVFPAALRQKSKRYGLWLHLCHECHMDLPNDRSYDRRLRAFAQGMAMEEYGWSTETFIKMFERNYR